MDTDTTQPTTSTELRDACCRVIESSQAPYECLHTEAHRLRPKVSAGEVSAHDAWHELLVAAVVAGIPARDASTILHRAFSLSIEVLP